MNKIAALPLAGFAPSNDSIAAHLRELADRIQFEDEDLRTVVLVIETADGDLQRQTFGHPCDRARVVGLLSMATTRAAVE